MKPDALIQLVDKWVTARTVKAARQLSRRHFLSRFGNLMVGIALVPVLPVARAAETRLRLPEIGDPQDCD